MNHEPMIEQIKRHEGFRDKPYFCSEGYKTIGYGTNLETRGLTEQEAEMLLLNDLAKIDSYLEKTGLLNGLNEARQAVLFNMCYQLGINGFSKFKNTIYYIAQGRYEDAAKEMLNSRWSMQTPSRAKELSEQMRTGEF
jgi:lysozyme